MKKNRRNRARIVGFYIKPNRRRPAKGVIWDKKGLCPCITDYSKGGNLIPTIVVEKKCDMIWRLSDDGSLMGRRKFKSGTIPMQRLQFSSSRGVAFTINSMRVPQVIVYGKEESDSTV